MMTDSELEIIKRRCDKATAGPWTPHVEGRDRDSGSDFIMTASEDERYQNIELLGATRDDLDFIAHAKQDIPRLLDEINRLKRLLKP